MRRSDADALADARQLEQAHSAPAMVGMIRRQLDRGFVLLRFEPALEQAFQRASDTAANTSRLALLIIAVFVLCLSPVLDQTYFGVPAVAAWWSRLLLVGVLVPVLVVAIGWCLLRPRSQATEGVIVVQFAIVSVGLLANHVILSRYGADFPIEFVAIGMVVVVALGRVRSWLILPVGTGLAGLTLATEVWLVDATPGDYYHLAAAGVLGLFAVYLQYASDYVLRGGWLDRQLLQLVARRDGLTGLLNRHALERALAIAQAHAVRESRGYGLAMIDIDTFGAYNNH